VRRFRDEVPGWPPLAGVAALLIASVVGALAPLPAGLAGGMAGAEESTPAAALLAALLFAAGVILVVTRLAALTRPVTVGQLGLRAPKDPLRAAALTFAAALGLAALAAVVALLSDLRGAVPVPAELDSRSLYAQAYDLPLREGAELGPGLLASALARCVVSVVAVEILLRGFAFPALSRWRGVWPAAIVVAVVFGGLGRLGEEPALALLSMALGGALCWLYLATGSLLPGMALSAGTAAVLLGVGCALPPAGVALLAVACAVAAPGAVAGLALLRRPRAPRAVAAPARRTA
jgi:membrane protease YdiL (CAAX protease family)